MAWWLLALALVALATLIFAMISLFDSDSSDTVPPQIRDEIDKVHETLDNPDEETLCDNLDSHKNNLQYYLNTTANLTEKQRDAIREALSIVEEARTLADCE